MKLKLMATVSAVWLSGSILTAYSQTTSSASTGEVLTTAGDPGLVIVLRGGETFSLSAGDQLFDGDRIITRTGASVEIEVDDCRRTIEAGSTVVIDSEFCKAVFATADETVLAAAVDTVTGGGTGAALPILGAALAAGGAAAAAGAGGALPAPPPEPPPPPPPAPSSSST